MFVILPCARQLEFQRESPKSIPRKWKKTKGKIAMVAVVQSFAYLFCSCLLLLLLLLLSLVVLLLTSLVSLLPPDGI